MTKNILLVAAAVVALGAAPAFANTTTTAHPATKSATKMVHAKKITHAKAIHHAKMSVPKSVNAKEKAMTRQLNKSALQGA